MLALGATVAHADTTVGGTVSYGNTYPFSAAYKYEYQQGYSYSVFSGPQLISGLVFNSYQGVNYSLGGATYNISLGYSALPVGSMSTNFSANDNSNPALAQQTIYNGVVSVSNQSSLVINATNPFLYNPALGDLLLQITKMGSEFGAFSAQFSTNSSNVERVYANNATINGVGINNGLITTFVSTPAILGTPGPIAGAGLVPLLGLAGAYLFGRKRLAA